jgi:hypothetical protein
MRKREYFGVPLILFLCLVSRSLTGDAWTVRSNGIGPVKIGMTLAQLSETLRQKLSEEESGTEGCFYIQARGHDHIAFMIIDGRLARIDVDASGIFTTSGLQVGDSEAHVRNFYGAKMKVTEHQYVDTGHYLTIRSDDPRYGMRFETDKGKITIFYAGTYHAIQYVEGCE